MPSGRRVEGDPTPIIISSPLVTKMLSASFLKFVMVVMGGY